jgi:3-hydroxybutyryl-CoA dehydrogenase
MGIQNVAVIGAGPLGRKLASRFARAGFDTVLEDILPSNLRKAAEAFSAVASALKETTACREGNRGSIRFAASVEDAVRSVDLIVDCVPDELESKLEIFSLLDRMAPPLAIFVTPTRSLSIADLASCTYRGDRCLAVQFPVSGDLNPESLDIVSTSKTSPEVLEAVACFWRRAGFAVELKSDPAEASVIAGTLF